MWVMCLYVHMADPGFMGLFVINEGWVDTQQVMAATSRS